MNNTIKLSVDFKNSGKRLDIFLKEKSDAASPIMFGAEN